MIPTVVIILIGSLQAGSAQADGAEWYLGTLSVHDREIMKEPLPGLPGDTLKVTSSCRLARREIRNEASGSGYRYLVLCPDWGPMGYRFAWFSAADLGDIGTPEKNLRKDFLVRGPNSDTWREIQRPVPVFQVGPSGGRVYTVPMTIPDRRIELRKECQLKPSGATWQRIGKNEYMLPVEPHQDCGVFMEFGTVWWTGDTLPGPAPKPTVGDPLQEGSTLRTSPETSVSCSASACSPLEPSPGWLMEARSVYLMGFFERERSNADAHLQVCVPPPGQNPTYRIEIKGTAFENWPVTSAVFSEYLACRLFHQESQIQEIEVRICDRGILVWHRNDFPLLTDETGTHRCGP